MERLLKFLIMVLLSFSAVQAQSSDPATDFGDWSIRCSGAEQKDCTLSLSVVRASDKTRVLEAQVVKTLETGPAMILSTPWGIRLPPGLALQIDKNRPKRFAFEFCDPSGCHLAVPLDKTNLRAFKKGLKAVMQFLDRNGKPVTVEISLIGFTKGYEAL